MCSSDLGSAPSRWMLMQDGSAYLIANRQGGPRGGSDIVLPNWWMSMGTRPLGAGTLVVSGMVSLDPATVGMGRAHGITFDYGVRGGRIGYPALAWLASLGGHERRHALQIEEIAEALGRK